MPEGDTVFHTAAVLDAALAGKTLTRCDIRVPRYAAVDLSGGRVDEVISRGKHLFLRVGPASIHSHLKMDGSWRVGTPARRGPLGHRVRIILEAGPVRALGIDLGVLVARARAMLWANRLRWARCTTGDTRPGRQLWVYGRAGRPCRRCGTPVSSDSTGERISFWCAACQR